MRLYIYRYLTILLDLTAGCCRLKVERTTKKAAARPAGRAAFSLAIELAETKINPVDEQEHYTREKKKRGKLKYTDLFINISSIMYKINNCHEVREH